VLAEHALILLAVALFVNLTTLVAYLWRAHRRETGPITLGFEGPVLCNIIALLVTWVPPMPWIVLVVPWMLHVGTWIAARRLAACLQALRSRSSR
jgi:hypothetical protein